MKGWKAVRYWISSGLLLSMIGCASLRNDDPQSAYSLPGDVDPDRGMFTEATDNIVKSFKNSVGLGPNERAAREQFAAAMNLYESASETEGIARKRQFSAAGEAFAKSAARWPNSSIAEDAMFFRAESYFFADYYPKAESVFLDLTQKYQSTKYIDRISQRRLQIAEYWLKHQVAKKELPFTPNFTAKDRPTFDQFGHAIRILERIRLDDPTGELADDATMMAAEACFKSERYYRADELLDDLRRSFPNSPHQYPAHKMGLQAKIVLYQGPKYDAGPLDDAEQLVKQMSRQFPNESRKDREYLQKMNKDVRMNRAIRAMELAKYRDRREEYGAAKAQYERIAREFEDTSLAQVATERIAQIGGRPAVPPQRLKVLAKAFPSDEKQSRPLIATRPSSGKSR